MGKGKKRLRSGRIKEVLASEASKAIKASKAVKGEKIKHLVGGLFDPPKQRFELRLLNVLHTRKKVWCFEWNPSPQMKPEATIKRRALASCGEDGVTIWDENVVAGQPRHVKQEKWVGMFRSCSWHPLGEMIAGGAFSQIEGGPHVYIWNYINDKWNEHSKICIEGSTGDVVGLSWVDEKLLCCTTDGHFYVIEVKMSGGYNILARHRDTKNVEINFVKWNVDNSNYFISGGHRGLEIYRFSQSSQELLWNIEKVAIRTSTTAAAGICFDLESDGCDFIVFKFSGGLKTWELKITKDYMGHDLISLNFTHMHGNKPSFESTMTTSTSTYFSFDWSSKIHKEDRYMVLGREDGMIEIYSCDNCYLSEEYYSIGASAIHTDIITCVKWSPWVKGVFASGSLDGTVKFWYVDDVTDYSWV